MKDSTAPDSKLVESLTRIAGAVARAKHEWVLRVFKTIMPADVYDATRFADRKAWARKRLVHWCEAYLVEIVDCPDRSEIWQGDKRIAAFRVTTVDGKIQFQEQIEPCQSQEKSL
jgi:hypothetical protein